MVVSMVLPSRRLLLALHTSSACLVSALTYTILTWLSSPLNHNVLPPAPATDFPWLTGEPTWRQFPPINGSHLLAWVLQTVAMFCLPSGVHGGVPLQDLLWTYKIPYPVNHWCFCCRLGSLLVSWLGNYEACRLADYSPTEAHRTERKGLMFLF